MNYEPLQHIIDQREGNNKYICAFRSPHPQIQRETNKRCEDCRKTNKDEAIPEPIFFR